MPEKALEERALLNLLGNFEKRIKRLLRHPAAFLQEGRNGDEIKLFRSI